VTYEKPTLTDAGTFTEMTGLIVGTANDHVLQRL